MGARLALLISMLLLAGSAQADRRPNIVLVIGDDHGWPYSGFMGDDTVSTPTLDRLAAQGTVFTHAQVPVSRCRPTLQTLLSGLHPEQWSVKRAALVATHGGIPERQEVQFYRTLPRELAREGYRSWEGGKLWEGNFEQAGFDDGTTRIAEQGPFRVDGATFGRDGWDPERCGEGRIRDEPCPALDPVRAFLEEVGDERFFLWFAPQLPHTPFDPPPEFYLPYLDRGDLSFAEVIYYAQVTRLDAAIGELLRELDARGLREQTLVVYISDNGWRIGQPIIGGTSDGKLSLHDLGTRTPIIFHWPGRVPHGVRRDDLVRAEDLFPTLLDYAGAQPLPDRRGVSLRSAIQSGGPVGVASYTSFFEGVSALYSGYFLRTAEWRYMLFGDGHEELYAMRSDPFEQVDLASSSAGLLAGFRQEVVAGLVELATPAPRLEVAGRLVSSGGLALAGAGVRLEGAGAPLQVLTDVRGVFRFQNLPHGSYRLAPGPGVEQLAGSLAVTLPVGSVGSYEPLVAVRRGTPTFGESTLSGRLRGWQGEGIGDAVVSVRREASDLEVTVRTDRDGHYRAENLPPGRYRIEPEPLEGYRSRATEVEVRPGQDPVRDVIAWKAPVS